MHRCLPAFLAALLIGALPGFGQNPNGPRSSVDATCYEGTWIGLNQANIDSASMRVREFSLTRLESLAEGNARLKKQSFILGDNGDYLVYEKEVEGELRIVDNRALFLVGNEIWKMNLERRGQNEEDSFSYLRLEVELDEGSTGPRETFFEDQYYRVETPDSRFLKGTWAFSRDRSHGSRSYSQYSNIQFREYSDFYLDDISWIIFQEGHRELVRDLKGKGSWSLEHGQIVLNFEKATPFTMEGEALALHFLGFNGNQMRMIDERGYLWKLQKQ